jgi:hypothetical protein
MIYSISNRASYHPIATFVSFLSLYINLHLRRCIIVLRLDSLSKFVKSSNCVRLHKLFIIQVVEEDIESFLCILYLGCECRRSFRGDSLHVASENLDHSLSTQGNVRSVSSWVRRLLWWSRHCSTRSRWSSRRS